MNGSLQLPPPTRQHKPHRHRYDSYDDYGYEYFTHSLIMHHSFDTCTPPLIARACALRLIPHARRCIGGMARRGIGEQEVW
jgi:hypothetical protein